MAAIKFEMADETLKITCEGGDLDIEVHGHGDVLAGRSTAAMHAIETGHRVRQCETTEKVIRPCRVR